MESPAGVSQSWRNQAPSQPLPLLCYYIDHRLKLGLTQSIALAKHLRGFLNILITHNDCFPKFCEIVTDSLVRLRACGLTTISRL